MTLRRCLLLLCCIASALTVLGATPREREAFEFLRKTTTLESPHVGFAGVFSRGYLALRIVNRSADADVLFKRLIGEAGAAGQLYGLIGVHRTDPAYFRSIAPKFASRRDSVSTIAGCIMGAERIAEIVTRADALVVRNGETLAEAVRRQPPGRTDIAHGGYTAWYLGPDSNEREAMKAEAQADFKE